MSLLARRGRQPRGGRRVPEPAARSPLTVRILRALIVAGLLLPTGCSTSSGPSPADKAAARRIMAQARVAAPRHNGRALASIPQNPAPTTAAAKPVIVRAGAAPLPSLAPAGEGGSAKPAGDVTLTFAGADIRDVIAEILGKTLKLNYVVDPAVKGPVTVDVSQPIPRADLLPMLEAVLNANGATMMRADGMIRIVPLRKAGKPGVAAPLEAGAVSRAIGARTEVFRLHYIAASQMRRVLQKVLPPGQPITADDAHQLLLVQGSAEALHVAADTVKIFDIDQLAGMSMALIPLRHGKPGPVVTELQNVFGATHKAANNSVIRFIPVDRLDAVMVLTRVPGYLDEARAWIARLDRSAPADQRQLYVYYLKHSKAVTVAQTLQGALSGLDVEVAQPAGNGGGSEPPAPGFEPKPEGAAGKGNGAAPPAAAGEVPPLLPPAAASVGPAAAKPGQVGVRIQADAAHNALLISATPRDYALVRKVLQGIDIPPMQVLIEVTVAEVELNNDLRYGVQYFVATGLDHSQGQGILSNQALPSGLLPSGITPTLPGMALALTSSGLQPRVILDALSQLTETRVISTPRLLVLDNQTAQLQVGDVVPIVTQSATSTITSNPLIVNNVQYKETGIVLKVTPQINAGGSVTLSVKLTDSSPEPTTVARINSPSFSQRRLDSTINVKSGTTVLLGGLIMQQNDRGSSGIPILHSLPLIGSLFGTHTHTGRRQELIMLLTPYVVSNDNEARDLTERITQEFENALGPGLPALRRPPRY